MIKLAIFDSIKLTLNQATRRRKWATAFLNTPKAVYRYFSNFRLLAMLFDYLLLDHFSVAIILVSARLTMCKTCEQTNDQKLFESNRVFFSKRFSGDKWWASIRCAVYLWSFYTWDYLRNFDPFIQSFSIFRVVFYRFSCYSCCLPPQN